MEIDIEFEWDADKKDKNLKKHGISFIAATKLLSSEHFTVQSDRNNEIRYLAIGEIENQVIAVVYTKRGEKYRIISARRARVNEEEAFKTYRAISCKSTSH